LASIGDTVPLDANQSPTTSVGNLPMWFVAVACSESIAIERKPIVKIDLDGSKVADMGADGEGKSSGPSHLTISPAIKMENSIKKLIGRAHFY
jgi:hypothetical protein